MRKRALITGITGQTGSYLAELLLEKGYAVFGLKRRTSNVSTGRIRHLLDKIHLIDGDMTDSSSLLEAVRTSAPDEVYNLAAQSFVKSSFSQPETTGDVTGIGVTRLLEAIMKFAPNARFYQASSSELFGSAKPPQNENTPFHPRSPYGVAKLYGYWITVNYRERDPGLFACNGILFNNESSRRGIEFVTQKIAHGAASIKLGLQSQLTLGNLEAKRDWGHSADYALAMWLMLQQGEPDDYVVATGEAHTVREFCEVSFSRLRLDYEKYVMVDEQFFRPTEVDYLLGDATKARTRLGWEPRISFQQLVAEMTDAALEKLSMVPIRQDASSLVEG
jgi:GDPmannose 4,6-dehydratase